MKILRFLFIALLLCSGTLSAQITFFEGTLDEAMAKAKAEKKDLFVDFYTDWCAPCKMMASQVFTLKEMGDYFNPNFISVKVNAEAKENKSLVQKYKIDAFPIMLFLNVKGEVLGTVRGAVAPDALLLEARIVKGDELTFEKLYEKCKKNKKDIESQQKMLLRAPGFMRSQTGYNQEKWGIRIEAAFSEYVKNKKLENMINESDFTILSMYHMEKKKTDPIFDFIVKNYKAFSEVTKKENVQNYIISLNNAYLIELCRNGKQEYKQELERVNGDLKEIYEGIPFGDLTAYEAVAYMADGYFYLFRRDMPNFFANIDKYFTGAKSVLSVNDYTQPIEDLFNLYQGVLPEDANPKVVLWLNNILELEMDVQLRVRLMMMMGECLLKMGDTTKAKQSYNQAFLLSAGIENPQMKAYLQKMIQDRINTL